MRSGGDGGANAVSSITAGCEFFSVDPICAYSPEHPLSPST